MLLSALVYRSMSLLTLLHLGELLGVEVDGVRGRVRPSMQRIWRARQAFAYLASGPRVTGEEVMILIGHAT